jgi:hypothetical protein
MKYAFIAVLLVSLPAAAAPAALPAGVRCGLVKSSAVLDLPSFCKSPLDKRRLVDYGSQLDLLDACGEKALAESVAKALRLKAERADAGSCAAIASDLVESLRPER